MIKNKIILVIKIQKMLTMTMKKLNKDKKLNKILYHKKIVIYKILYLNLIFFINKNYLVTNKNIEIESQEKL